MSTANFRFLCSWGQWKGGKIPWNLHLLNIRFQILQFSVQPPNLKLVLPKSHELLKPLEFSILPKFCLRDTFRISLEHRPFEVRQFFSLCKKKEFARRFFPDLNYQQKMVGQKLELLLIPCNCTRKRKLWQLVANFSPILDSIESLHILVCLILLW